MRAHYLAFRLLLTSVPLLSGMVFSAVRRVSGAPVRDNYVVLFPDGPADFALRYTEQQSPGARSRWRFDVRVVATTADGMLQIADQVLLVVGQVPVVAGRVCEPVRLVPSVEEGKGQYDPVTDLHYMDLSFEFWSSQGA